MLCLDTNVQSHSLRRNSTSSSLTEVQGNSVLRIFVSVHRLVSSRNSRMSQIGNIWVLFLDHRSRQREKLSYQITLPHRARLAQYALELLAHCAY